VHCPKEDCSNIIEIVNKGKEPSNPQEHKERFRFRCRECTCEFCASCLSVPYHENYTCIQYKKFKEAKHCRFCGDQLTGSNSIIPKLLKAEALIDVCQKPDCKSRADKICTKQLPCKHYCGGVIREKTCLPCLNPDCRPKDSGQTGEDYCNICWTEDLKSAPSIQLQCGHIFHYQCVDNQLTKRWHTTNISFGFCDCPLCSRWMSHPSLQELMTPIKQLYNDIKDKALQRLKFQNLEIAKEIATEGEIFYKNPLGYALKRFCYYPCFKCKKPYFGGERACNAELLVNPNFNPAELLCGSCSAGDNKQNCNKHGTDYIVWKCKFCCQIACWFCWGNTHFCEDCHKQAVKISQTARDLLPKCSCHVDHPQNGEEHCFGCSLCLANTTNF
jgi:E3 ubiquitin-protein ligase MYCBP2